MSVCYSIKASSAIEPDILPRLICFIEKSYELQGFQQTLEQARGNNLEVKTISPEHTSSCTNES